MISLYQLVRQAYCLGFEAGKCAWNKPYSECLKDQESGVAQFRNLPDIAIVEASDNKPPVEASSEECAFHRWQEIQPKVWKCIRKDCGKEYDYNSNRVQNS